jgi:hypothetical protein
MELWYFFIITLGSKWILIRFQGSDHHGGFKRVALAHIELFKYPLCIGRLVYKHSFREVFKLQAQTELGFTQVFHLKLCLEVSH